MWRVLQFLWPELDDRTDRLVRRLVVADLVLLILASWAAWEPLVIFTTVLAANGVGAIAGLLFAVPRQIAAVRQAKAEEAVDGPPAAIVANTSLEDVSDWLTKTIIGAGLVSWSSILARLDFSGSKVGIALAGPDHDLALAGGVALLVAAATIGALAGYLWFAMHLPEALATSGARAFKAGKEARVGLAQSDRPVAPAMPDFGPVAPPPDGPLAPAAAPPPPPASPPGRAGDGDDMIEMLAAGKGERKKGKKDGAARADRGPAAIPPVPPPVDQSALLRQAAEAKYAQLQAAPLVLEDWANGMFGGQSTVTNGFGTRSLTATVSAITSDWFNIKLICHADPRPTSEAIFFLHNTFPNTTPTVAFDAEGVARLSVNAWGAFTVGVLLDDGTTALELNLASLAEAPKKFRER